MDGGEARVSSPSYVRALKNWLFSGGAISVILKLFWFYLLLTAVLFFQPVRLIVYLTIGYSFLVVLNPGLELDDMLEEYGTKQLEE